MSNFITDNTDLQFYLDRWVDWERLYTLTELNPSDPTASADAEEASDLWKEILHLEDRQIQFLLSG